MAALEENCNKKRSRTTTTQGKPSVHELTYELLMKSFANWLLMNLLCEQFIQLKTSLISVKIRILVKHIREPFANVHE